MNVDYAWQYDDRGRTARTGDAEHVRDMIEQLLLTSPGERVNRPDFGSGLLAMTFEPNSPELASALQFTIQAALQRWLGDLIDVHAVEAAADDSTLSILVAYVIKRTGEARADTFTRSATP